MNLKDKVPPHNLVAEQATLGALLLDWDALGNVISYLRPERFYSLQNQKIFEAILSLDSRGIRGDIVTLIDELRSNGNLEAAGGPAYIPRLTSITSVPFGIFMSIKRLPLASISAVSVWSISCESISSGSSTPNSFPSFS